MKKILSRIKFIIKKEICIIKYKKYKKICKKERKKRIYNF